MMKKIIILLITLMFIVPCFADTTYTIDTDYGEKTVVVPDGYTDKDVLLIITKNYYELNEEDKQLKEKITELNTQVTDYISENQSLREKNTTLTENYAQLLKKYETLNSMGFIRGFVGGGLSYTVGQNSKVSSGGLNAGIIIGDSFMFSCGVNYPWRVDFGIGVVF